MCNAHSKVTHIKQQNSFITLRAVGITHDPYQQHRAVFLHLCLHFFILNLTYSFRHTLPAILAE